MTQLRVLRLRECKSVSASAFAEQHAFASLQILDMYRCFAFCLEGAPCCLLPILTRQNCLEEIWYHRSFLNMLLVLTS